MLIKLLYEAKTNRDSKASKLAYNPFRLATIRAWLLYYVSGLTVRDIAKVLNVSFQYVHSLIKEVNQALPKYVEYGECVDNYHDDRLDFTDRIFSGYKDEDIKWKQNLRAVGRYYGR